MSIGTKERHAQSEHSNEFPNREVHSTGNQHSNLWAGKLVLSHPLWGGNIYWGTELSSTNSRGDFNNKEQIVAASETNIKERYHALFTEYTHSFGKFTLNTGLRYEHVTSDYYSFGVKQADTSKHYSNLFPSFPYHGIMRNGAFNSIIATKSIVQAIVLCVTSYSITIVMLMKEVIRNCILNRYIT